MPLWYQPAPTKSLGDVAPPSARGQAGRPGEDAGEVTLIRKAARERDCRYRDPLVSKELPRGLHPALEQPLVRCHPGRPTEGAGEMTVRKPAGCRQLTDRDVAGKVGSDKLLGAPLLPRGEATTPGGRARPHAAILLRHMNGGRLGHLVDEEVARAIRMLERGQRGHGQ